MVREIQSAHLFATAVDWTLCDPSLVLVLQPGELRIRSRVEVVNVLDEMS